jgi:hypothetical protein
MSEYGNAMVKKSEETFPVMEKGEYDQRFVTVVTDEKKIRTLRITSSEYDRLMKRSEKEYLAKGDTLWNKLALAFKMLF